MLACGTTDVLYVGTKGYLAPEMLRRHSYDKAIDMWSLGVIVFVLLCGCLPFDDDSSKIPDESAARKKFTLRFPKWANNLSASAKDLLQHLLEIDPKKRYTADEALNHPWVSGKTVMPNSYLQSPCVIGERRHQLRSSAMKEYMHDIGIAMPGTTVVDSNRSTHKNSSVAAVNTRVRKNSF
jgi:serine/threonine protein kinase